MEKHEIQIDTPFIRLDQMLKFCGLAETGGHAKEIVEEGVCKVNGAICIQRGKKQPDRSHLAAHRRQELPGQQGRGPDPFWGGKGLD